MGEKLLPTSWEPTRETPLGHLDPSTAERAARQMESIPMADWIQPGSALETLSARDLGIFLIRRLRLLGLTRISDADLAVTFRVSRQHVQRIFDRTNTLINGDPHGDDHHHTDDRHTHDHVQSYRADGAAADDDSRSEP